MGKNRSSKSSNGTGGGSGWNYEDEGTYISSYTGEEVPRGNLTSEEMDEFNEKAERWLRYYSHNPDAEMNMEEMKYIFSHFLSTVNNSDVPDGHLYRFENAYHFENSDYHVGDKLDGNGSLRSFSKKLSATNEMLNDRFNGYDEIVIYRTVGETPYFDVGKHANPFSYQEECFVPLDTMRIENILRYSGSSMRDEIYDKYNIDLGNYQYLLDHVTVVDVSYDSSVKSVVDVHGRTIDARDIL